MSFIWSSCLSGTLTNGPHFQDHIQDISKPHKFEFTRDDAAASGGSLRTALWSNTPLSEPVQILKSAPTGTPEIRAGRPLLYALCDKKKPDAVKVQRYLDDFKKVRSYITDLAVQWHFSPVERESWKNLLDDLDEMQTAPSAAFSGFWPQRKEEVDDFLREHGQTAPAEARHTMATNADLNNAEAARVEAEVRAQVLQDDSAFRGVHAGAKERLHDNTSPSDAKGSNLVVIDVSDTKGGKKPVDTSWEKCLTLPWKLVEAVPLSYAKAIHDASGSREVFNEDGTMSVGGGQAHQHGADAERAYSQRLAALSPLLARGGVVFVERKDGPAVLRGGRVLRAVGSRRRMEGIEGRERRSGVKHHTEVGSVQRLASAAQLMHSG
eukprot:jgi/Tetstr1/458845/TSEL_004354.t1